VEVDEKETSYLGAIYVDFSKYLSLEEPCMSKENSRNFFLFLLFFFLSQVRVSNARRYLPIFLVKMKIRKISKLILEQCRFIRILAILKQWKYKRKDCKNSP
jgi:hypothetical protein